MSVPKEIEGLPVIASVSGGKDSTALMLHLREIGVPFRAVFADTGWEAPETYAYLDLLRERIGPIDVVGVPGGMRAKIEARAGFPSRKQRWCSPELKIEPVRAYHDAVGDDTVSAVGVRRDESAARAGVAELEDDAEWGGWIWRPLAAWPVADVLAIHHRHGLPVNPLYQRGHGRVGCWPCIYASKEQVRLLADADPGRIDEIRAMEAATSAERARRNVDHVPTEKRPQRYASAEATFFQSRAGAPVGIDAAVAWSRTSKGGRQLPLLAEPPSGGCFRWGMCEPPSKDAA